MPFEHQVAFRRTMYCTFRISFWGSEHGCGQTLPVVSVVVVTTARGVGGGAWGGDANAYLYVLHCDGLRTCLHTVSLHLPFETTFIKFAVTGQKPLPIFA